MSIVDHARVLSHPFHIPMLFLQPLTDLSYTATRSGEGKSLSGNVEGSSEADCIMSSELRVRHKKGDFRRQTQAADPKGTHSVFLIKR